MIKVYAKSDCSKCKVLKNILDEKKVDYEYVEDLKTLMIIASRSRIMSAPVIEKDGKAYSMEQFLEVL
ncbi:glutaredoxin-like protein NrdH [Fusobacterium necrogenes]|uniref:Glutaredoxin-like protein NrdH n=1 Tax=Fusobacterium necrogenes TaxID=858 RepID=A0A377GYM8_9FUSO|nr:glutaredoxin domain-containing protein [Fusobacterium necrogenes]STO31684.1 glutaredoxin-like protein NrdH [Fusobacterium necrogenes]